MPKPKEPAVVDEIARGTFELVAKLKCQLDAMHHALCQIVADLDLPAAKITTVVFVERIDTIRKGAFEVLDATENWRKELKKASAKAVA